MIQTVKVNEIEMDYCSFGTGKDVFVIIPGLSLLPVTPSEIGIKSTFKDFLNHFTVYLFDRRKNAPCGYSIEEMAEDTYYALKKLNIENITLYGASQGGMIAQYIAVNHPKFVSKLILASTVGRVNKTLYDKIEGWVQLAINGSAFELNEKMNRDIFSDNTFSAYKDVLLSPGNRITEENLKQFANIASAILSFDVHDKLHEVKCPSLVIGSEGDAVMTPEGIAELADTLGSESHMFCKEYGHAVYDEAPDFYKRVMEFSLK